MILGNVFQYKTIAGQPIRHGDLVVTPVRKSLVIKLPYWLFIWERPIAVVVENGESRTEKTIVDLTLLAQIGLYAIGLVALVVGLLALPTRRRKRSNSLPANKLRRKQ